MNLTGITRRIDALGRVVIPRDVRRMLNIKEGDVMEISVDMENHSITIIPHTFEEFSKELTDSLEHPVTEYAEKNNISQDNKAQIMEHIADDVKRLINRER